MTVIFGPTSGVTIPSFASVPLGNRIVSGASVNVGTVITVTWTLSQYVAGSGPWSIEIGVATVWHGVHYDMAFDNHTGGTRTWTSDVVSSDIVVNLFGSTTNGYADGVQVDTTFSGPPPAPCQYGTELTVPGTFIYYLTPAVIDALLVEVGALPLAPLFTAFWFAAVDMRELCSGLPPPVPAIDVRVFTWSPAALYQLLHSLAWWYFCKCTSGPTTPVTPTKPVVVTPPGMPTQPTFPCDPAALCAALVTIQRQLASLSAAVGLDYNADTLMQRYALPFAFIAGAVHTVAGTSGSFAVSRLVGMRAELVSAPPSFVLEGTPPYLWDLGWMSVSDGGAMLQEKRITRTSMDWTPQGMQLGTLFGWYAKPGVSLKFTELQAEP